MLLKAAKLIVKTWKFTIVPSLAYPKEGDMHVLKWVMTTKHSVAERSAKDKKKKINVNCRKLKITVLS